jgi:hypothetical protein
MHVSNRRQFLSALSVLSAATLSGALAGCGRSKEDIQRERESRFAKLATGIKEILGNDFAIREHLPPKSEKLIINVTSFYGPDDSRVSSNNRKLREATTLVNPIATDGIVKVMRLAGLNFVGVEGMDASDLKLLLDLKKKGVLKPEGISAKTGNNPAVELFMRGLVDIRVIENPELVKSGIDSHYDFLTKISSDASLLSKLSSESGVNSYPRRVERDSAQRQLNNSVDSSFKSAHANRRARALFVINNHMQSSDEIILISGRPASEISSTIRLADSNGSQGEGDFDREKIGVIEVICKIPHKKQ